MERPTPPARGRGAGRKAWRAHPCHQRRPCHGRAVVPGAGGKIYTCGASASPLQCSPSPAGQFYELTLSNRPGDFDDSETVLFREIARVIDGQHRIAGLKDYTGTPDAFQVNVAVFVGADIADQANIFS